VFPVPVGGDEVVDARCARFPEGLLDAIGVARARPARVHQHRLPRRRDDQRGRAALHVDPIDLEALLLRRRGGEASGGQPRSRDSRQDLRSHLSPPGPGLLCAPARQRGFALRSISTALPRLAVVSLAFLVPGFGGAIRSDPAPVAPGVRPWPARWIRAPDASPAVYGGCHFWSGRQ